MAGNFSAENGRVRVANELGAGSGKGARFSIVVSITTSVVIGLVFWCLILTYNDQIALLFSSGKAVLDAVHNLSMLLAFTILLNSVQPVLSGTYISFYSSIQKCQSSELYCNCGWLHCIAGVAIGSGWQALVAYVNIGSYYLVGVPIGIILGWPLGFGVRVGNGSSEGRRNKNEQKKVWFGIHLLIILCLYFAGYLVWVDWWDCRSDTGIGLPHYAM